MIVVRDQVILGCTDHDIKLDCLIENGPNASLEEVMAFVESKESVKLSLQQLNEGPMQLHRSVRFENKRGKCPSSKLHPHPCFLRRALTAARSAMVAAETSDPTTA